MTIRMQSIVTILRELIASTTDSGDTELTIHSGTTLITTLQAGVLDLASETVGDIVRIITAMAIMAMATLIVDITTHIHITDMQAVTMADIIHHRALFTEQLRLQEAMVNT